MDVTIGSSAINRAAVQAAGYTYVNKANPAPADGATDIPITTTLSWSGGDPDAGDTRSFYS